MIEYEISLSLDNKLDGFNIKQKTLQFFVIV